MKKAVQKIVAAGIIVKDDKVLIIQRTSNDTFPNMLEIPSGKREEFETTIGVFEFKVERSDEIRDVTQICFLCKLIGKIEVKLSNEHQNFAWITKDELDNYKISEETKENLIKAFVYT